MMAVKQNPTRQRLLDYGSTFLLLIPILAWSWSSQQIRQIEQADFRVNGKIVQRGRVTKSSTHKFSVTGEYIDISHNGTVERYWLEYAVQALGEVFSVGNDISIVATERSGIVCEVQLGANVVLAKAECLLLARQAQGWFWRILVPFFGIASLCVWPLILISIYWDGRRDASEGRRGNPFGSSQDSN